jgi:hypothetical protein
MIEKRKDFLVLKLNSSLYDKKTVVDAFNGLKNEADALLEEDGYFVIKIKKSREGENPGYEFANYILKLMKNKGVV